MANSKTVSTATPSKNPSVEEIREWYNKNRSAVENYASAKESIKKLRDITKSASNKRIETINKETLATYFANIGANEANLRAVARYLYYRSNIFFRIVNFYADMWDLRCRKVVPDYDLVKSNDSNKILKSLNDTLDVLERMDLHGALTEALICVYLEDVYYGIRFMDETGMFLYRLDPDECIIDGRYMTKDLSFAVDMSKWRSTNRQAIIEFLGSPFKEMWAEYERTGQKYIHVPDEYAVCLKFRSDLWDTVVPPFSSLFLQLTALEDNIDQQAVADELNIYKLIYLPMKVLSGATESDDFEVTPDITLEYFDRLQEQALPPYVAGAVIPGDELKTIDFSNSVDNDVNRVEKAQSQILSTAGGGAVLNSSGINSTAAFNAWLKEETEFALSTLMPQVNGITNRILSYELSNPCRVDHFEVSIYTKEEFRKAMLESCQYSFANRIAYNTLLGISEKETLAQLYLETEVLKLQDSMIYPLTSSFTASGDPQDVGRPALDDTEPISDSGDRSRNQ